MATKKQDTSSRIADNKKAAYNYFFEERFEAGMVLEGWEVKSLREGKVQLTDGYVVIRDGELFVIGCQINPLKSASLSGNPRIVRRQRATDAPLAIRLHSLARRHTTTTSHSQLPLAAWWPM